MVRYADTCLLLSLFFRDAGTDAALEWLERAGTEPIAISHWTRTEFASAAGIMARRGDLSPALHAEGLKRFDTFATARLITDAVTPPDFLRARVWLEDYPAVLRAGDALHLALCARQGRLLCTADETLAAAASGHGVAVLLV